MHDIKDILDGLRRTPAILDAFVQEIPEQRRHRRRGDGFWTIAEHVSHLAQVQPMLLDRIETFMIQDEVVFSPFIPGEGPDTPEVMEMTAALEQHLQVRSKQLTLLQTADDAVWQKAATHPEYEAYSLSILTRHMLMHDHWHMYRMEELWLTRDAYLTNLE